jgi:hypothetical protein
MFNNLKKAFPVMVLLLAFACKNPVEDVKIVVDTNIIKYSSLVHIIDDSGNIPANITLTVTGAMADNVYEISGKKALTVKDGIISLGLHPSVNPTANNVVKFNVVINAPGYQQLTKEIQFVQDQFQQVVNLTLFKVGTPVVDKPVVTPVPTTTKVALNFKGRCANNTNLEIRPSIYVFFKESGSSAPYQYLGYMDKGYIETFLLTTGKTYEFKITYSGENYTVTRKIEQTEYTEVINMSSSVCNTF